MKATSHTSRPNLLAAVPTTSRKPCRAPGEPAAGQTKPPLAERRWVKVLAQLLDAAGQNHGTAAADLICQACTTLRGVEAAAMRYFHHPASQLSQSEAARIAAILPLPKKRSAVAPSGFTRRHGNAIARRSAVVRNDGLDACLR